MKKVIVFFAVLVLSLSLMLPAFAAEGDFVPSIGYKDGPEIGDAEMGSEEVQDCLVITSLKGAEEKTTDISQEDRDLLLEVYEKLQSGEMKLPVGEGFVIRELVDLNWKETECVGQAHTHEEDLNKQDVTVTVDLDLGVTVENELLVFAYRDGQWEQVQDVRINADGTVTCVFEHFCPVAFAVRQQGGGSQTGDVARESLVIYGVLMALSMVAIVALVIRRKKQAC